MILYDTVTLLIKTKISQKFSIFSSLESYSINRILDDTLYRSSFLRLLLRSIVSDNCMIVSCDEKLSKIVAGVNSQKKLREILIFTDALLVPIAVSTAGDKD